MISRIFVGENENTSAQRKRQIDTLKIFNDNVIEIVEDVEYKIEFNAGGTAMAILVSLSPEFPLEKPVLKISPVISHPWVNEKGEITNAPGLLNFSIHSDLGRVVQAIIREYERKPPLVPTDSSSGSTSQAGSIDVAINGRSTPSYGFPTFPTTTIPSTYSGGMYQTTYTSPSQQQFLRNETFPELANLSKEELKQLSENEDLQDEFLQNLPQMKSLYEELENMITKNEELANENLSKEPILENLRHIILNKMDTMLSLKSSYDGHSLEYQKFAEKYAPENIRESLKLAAMQSDEDSEKLASRFLNGELEVEQFIHHFIEIRKLCQSRKTKEEKLSHQLKELKKAGY